MYTFRDVLVVVLARELLEPTSTLLEEVLEEGVAPGHVLLCDDASTDGSGDALRNRFPGILAVQNEEPAGWAAGMNRGLRHALEYGLPLVALLTPDLRPEPGMLGALLGAMNETPSLALAAPVSIGVVPGEAPPEAPGAALLRSLSPGGCPLEGLGAGPSSARAGMLLRAAVVEEVGFLEERYGDGWAELELCVRLRSRGARACLVPAARARPGVAGGSRERSRRDLLEWRNRWLYLRRVISWERWPEAVAVALGAALYETTRRLVTRGESARPPLVGTWQGLRGRFEGT